MLNLYVLLFTPDPLIKLPLNFLCLDIRSDNTSLSITSTPNSLNIFLFNIPDTLCKVLKVINPKNIIKAIDRLLSTLPIPDPLPKYEKLLPINLGYLAWLIIGFCPAGKKAFGIPGFP